jgi:uncharacterized membrane protein (UPF0127 family)
MLKNITKNTIISKKLKFCNSLFSKATGLMFSKKKDRALVFDFFKEKIISLHMLFVFYPIDVLFLDDKKRVVEIKQNLKPFRLYTPKKKARFVIEVINGVVKSSRTRIGDKVQF